MITHNFSTAVFINAFADLPPDVCRFTLFSYDHKYLFSLIISEDEVYVQLPEYLSEGMYIWQFNGNGIEKNGTMRILGTPNRLRLFNILAEAVS
jgi:hypothetical protein